MKISPYAYAHPWINKVLSAIIAAEAGPSEADLAHAPVLSDWKPAISPDGHVVLWGEVAGHPILGTESMTTSPLIAINPEAGWARTASRWYRLGRSIDALEVELADAIKEKQISADAVRFTMPGFTNIDDPALLAQLLAQYITRVREICAADRAASGREV